MVHYLLHVNSFRIILWWIPMLNNALISLMLHFSIKQGRVNSEAAMSNAITKQKYALHVLKICTWSHSASWVV